ncbi:P27 family phage terminase small subunit [Lactiplantibacillus plantarum]|uniref:P27 family phage terminase small subunit n=1 Tax=Lactiplantibacillus plantarum TaxID=1590 RepID=UPI0021CB92AA|nr:P27 family phage terminase small subunit [Lactiplantibacillus plantarum]
MQRIDKKSAVEKEKVDRYISLLDAFYQLDESIQQHGVMVKIENGKQIYWKTNPAVSEKNRINSALIRLKRTLNPLKPPLKCLTQPLLAMKRVVWYDSTEVC